jgi:hypothetical protein
MTTLQPRHEVFTVLVQVTALMGRVAHTVDLAT